MPNPIYDANTLRLSQIIRPVQVAKYTCDIEWKDLDSALHRYGETTGGLELNPDFQRGHVWTQEQGTRFIENRLRGLVSGPALVIQMNCANWESDHIDGDLQPGIQCLDGLQRITAVQKFMAGEIKPFGLTVEDLRQSKFQISFAFSFKLEVFDYQTRSQLLRHYIDFNSAGVAHSPEEIQRVKDLMAKSCPEEIVGNEVAEAPSP